jgi:ATP-dependent DNA helicase RecG
LRTSPRYIALLQQADITTVKDFLMNFPRTHEDRSNIKSIQALDANGEIESVKAFVVEKKLIPIKSPKKLYEIRIQDEEGSQAVISLFNNPWAFKSYEVGQWYIITGKVEFKYNKITFSRPDATKTPPPDIDEEDSVTLNSVQGLDAESSPA